MRTLPEDVVTLGIGSFGVKVKSLVTSALVLSFRDSQTGQTWVTTPAPIKETTVATFLRLVVFATLVVTGAWLAPGAGAQMTDTAETTTDTAESPDGSTDDTAQADDTEGDLPNTGASVWLYAVVGGGVLHIGGWMLVAERRLRRENAYWERHTD